MTANATPYVDSVFAAFIGALANYVIEFLKSGQIQAQERQLQAGHIIQLLLHLLQKGNFGHLATHGLIPATKLSLISPKV
jgi:hypothetical protein